MERRWERISILDDYLIGLSKERNLNLPDLVTDAANELVDGNIAENWYAQLAASLLYDPQEDLDYIFPLAARIYAIGTIDVQQPVFRGKCLAQITAEQEIRSYIEQGNFSDAAQRALLIDETRARAYLTLADLQQEYCEDAYRQNIVLN